MLGMIDDPRAAVAIGTIFGTAARDIRSRCDESVEAQNRGERGIREDSLTDELVSQMRNAIAGQLEAVGNDLSQRGIDAQIEFTPTNLPIGEEDEYGADIGIRISIHTPSAVVVKGILIQCKKMVGQNHKASFPELRGRGEAQAAKMLRITPASFFMLFNSGSQSELLNWSSIPSGMVCPMDGAHPIPSPKRFQIGDQCPIWNESGGGMWDMGISMLPASRVLSLSASAAARGSLLDTNASRLLRGTLPFGVFIVDLFASCFVGDVREEVVRITTPPRLRQRQVLSSGLPRDDFAGFAVRHYMNIELTAREQ